MCVPMRVDAPAASTTAVTIPGFYAAIIDQELFDRVQGKLRLSAANWRNSYANRTTYLLSGLVVCDACGRRYLGTAAKGGKFHYYSCGSYLKGGKETCAARLINKNKLESAVLAKIQEQILTPTNIRSYIQRVMESALSRKTIPHRSKRRSDWRLMTFRPDSSVGKMPSSPASFPSNMRLNE